MKKEKTGWPKQSTSSVYEEDASCMQKRMKLYGQKKAKSVRTARRFLRTVGLSINNNGYLVSRETVVTISGKI